MPPRAARGLPLAAACLAWPALALAAASGGPGAHGADAGPFSRPGDRSLPPPGGGARPTARADTTAVLAGRVLLAESGAPAEAARVELVGQGRTALTDSLGRFRLEGLAPGGDSVRISRLDRPGRTRAVRLEAGAVTRIEVALEPRVVEIGGLRVTVEGRRPTELERLADRIDRGAGQYITHAELEDHEGRLSFAFRGLLGARVAFVRGGDFRVLLRDERVGRRGYCSPELFVDGNRQPGVPVDAYDPDEVAAIEVYTGHLVPGEFRTRRARGCGAVLIWTRGFVR